MEQTARAVLKIDDQYVFIKRINKPKAEYSEYFAFVGGHLEKSETFEEACIREVYEELGINVKIQELFYEEYNNELNRNEKFYIVEYISGKLGTGKGEEFTNFNPEKYGIYEVAKIDSDKLRDYNILPKDVKEKLIEHEDNKK